MMKVDQIVMEDAHITPRKVMLRYALDAAKRHGDLMFYIARAVSVVSIDYDKAPLVRWVFDVYGHEVEIPDSMKHWKELLDKNSHVLSNTEAGNE